LTSLPFTIEVVIVSALSRPELTANIWQPLQRLNLVLNILLARLAPVFRTSNRPEYGDHGADDEQVIAIDYHSVTGRADHIRTLDQSLLFSP
jgi:hypothetical protein